MAINRNEKYDAVLFNYVLGLGDDLLIAGHRLSEWCGHAPLLEEDIALSNIALDMIGGADAFLQLAGGLEGKGRSADDLAFFREAVEFKNYQLLELPIGDFAFTMMRQFIFDNYSYFLYGELSKSRNPDVAAIAARIYKEVLYHMRHSGEWMQRLGGGTEESRERMQKAADELWTYTRELFQTEDEFKILAENGIIPDMARFREKWFQRINESFAEAGIIMPSDDRYFSQNSRKGFHTEYLGHLLSEMQIVARSFPEAKW